MRRQVLAGVLGFVAGLALTDLPWLLPKPAPMLERRPHPAAPTVVEPHRAGPIPEPHGVAPALEADRQALASSLTELAACEERLKDPPCAEVISETDYPPQGDEQALRERLDACLGEGTTWLDCEEQPCLLAAIVPAGATESLARCSAELGLPRSGYAAIAAPDGGEVVVSVRPLGGEPPRWLASDRMEERIRLRSERIRRDAFEHVRAAALP